MQVSGGKIGALDSGGSYAFCLAFLESAATSVALRLRDMMAGRELTK